MAIPSGYGVATLHWSQSNGPTDITVTHGYIIAGSGTANEAAEAIESYFIAGDCPCYPANMTVGWTFVGVSTLENAEDVLYAGTSYSNTAGTAVDINTAVPSYTPMVVTKRTGISGVQYRGRMYPPFTKEDAEGIAGNGQIDGAALTIIQGDWTNAFDLWSGGVYTPTLLHNVPTGGGSAPAPTEVTSWQVQPVVGIQRRRKLRA